MDASWPCLSLEDHQAAEQDDAHLSALVRLCDFLRITDLDKHEMRRHLLSFHTLTSPSKQLELLAAAEHSSEAELNEVITDSEPLLRVLFG